MPWWDPDADASVSPDTDSVTIGGRPIARGSLVRLRPGARRADAQDMFLVGRIAEVQAVLHDVENNPYLAVSLAGQPDEDLRIAHGRFLYFMPDEVEPHEDGVNGPVSGPVSGRTLVAGVGNVFLRDDAFGVEVIRLLSGRPVPDGVQVKDFGIRGVHLAYDLLDGCELFVLVDAAQRGEAPGTVTVLEVEVPEPDPAAGPVIDAHSLTPDGIFALLGSLGGRPGRSLLVACEPADVSAGMGLSGPVLEALPHAVRTVEEILAGKGAE